MDAPSDSPVNLKHRLTGAIILLLMPILLLPWWLDTSAVPQREREAAAAFQPNSDFVSALESPRMALTDSRGEGATEIITTSESGSAAGAPVTSPNPASETLHDSTAGVLTKSGWFVQVGAFKQIENLEQRETRLAENGISSIREQIKIDNQPAWRLVLGPFESKETAERESGKATLITGERAVIVGQSY